MARFLYLVAVLLHLTGSAVSLTNPIIPGWNPDGHVLRVEDTYYVAVSSFLTFPGIPIYQSKDLANWELVSHALDSSSKMPIHGAKNNNGAYAPSLAFIDGLFYMTTMVMWGSDPRYRSFPRMFWISSPDLKTWSDIVWGEPNGIDPHLFKDPNSEKTYLTLMGFNDAYDRLWGITQCEVDLVSGKCVGPYRNIWNGTIPIDAAARPEGPKLFSRGDWYYLAIAEGGTGPRHRATIARSHSPEGPWEASPTNPLLYHGGNLDLTVGNTGHVTCAETPDGDWFVTFLACRYVDEWSVLGRETFFAPVQWRDDGWPTINHGEPILLSQKYDLGPDVRYPRPPFKDRFDGDDLSETWYQLRSPYTKNYHLMRELGRSKCNHGILFEPNVYTLNDRDTPAAVLRQQSSVNMTFVATLLPTSRGLGPLQSIGVSAYSYEGAHQSIGIRGCVDQKRQCIYVDSWIGAPGPGVRANLTQEIPMDFSIIPRNLSLHIRAEPRIYSLGYSFSNSSTKWVHSFSPAELPVGFDGVMFGLFASGNGKPWPYDAPEVGFLQVREKYYDEGFSDYRSDRDGR